MKRINGTFFEFYHHNRVGGTHWNDQCREYTEEQWETKVDEIAALGMKYIVLMESALVYPDSAESYFPTDIYPPAPMKAKDPIGAMMRAAERNGLKVFMSCGFYGIWNHTRDNITSEEVKARAFKAMKQLYERYGKSDAFYGWYLPDETEIGPYFDEDFIKYVNEYAAYGRSFDENLKILIAPYGTRLAVTDAHYIEQLKRLDCDIVAYQDEVGVEKATPEQTKIYFKNLNQAHKAAGRSVIWADMETFQCEGKVYHSPMVGADGARIKAQMESISDYVEEIIIYIYQGTMNPPDTKVLCGHPSTVKLYRDLFLD
ncbi:MAG: DUF4434 domain-containing protein [Ruminococcaceae bacterium]|nr:DUF4434 domain-containing protein [Oscillospiraceae bacterium]